jgi:hypothetical protein
MYNKLSTIEVMSECTQQEEEDSPKNGLKEDSKRNIEETK